MVLPGQFCSLLPDVAKSAACVHDFSRCRTEMTVPSAVSKTS